MKIVALMPTYRRRKFVGNAIQCFLSQTYSDKKLLIVDDSKELAEQEGNNWKIIHSKKFTCLGAKYNYMIGIARKLWKPDAFAIMEDDDVFLPDYLSYHVSALTQFKKQWSHPSQVMVKIPKGEWIVEHNNHGNMHGSMSFTPEIYDAVGGYPEHNAKEFDLEFMGKLSNVSRPADPCSLGPPQFFFRWDTETPHAESFFLRDKLNWLENYQSVINKNTNTLINQIVEPNLDEETKKIYNLYNVPILSICIPTCDDFDGLFFTITSLILYHPEILQNIEIIVADNNPESKHGKDVHNFVDSLVSSVKIKYLPVTDVSGTAIIKQRAVDNATGTYILCMDGHVQIVAKALSRLIEFYKNNPDAKDLYCGPLIYNSELVAAGTDQPISVSPTHLDRTWSGEMLGVWGYDTRGAELNNDPFEIPAMGCYLFSCRRDAFVGFNSDFRGFGAEEYYLHDKTRQAGNKVICLPFLRGVHRFARPNGVPYKISRYDKVKNYIIGHLELGQPLDEIHEHFVASELVTEEIWNRLVDEATALASKKPEVLSIVSVQPLKLPFKRTSSKKRVDCCFVRNADGLFQCANPMHGFVLTMPPGVPYPDNPPRMNCPATPETIQAATSAGKELGLLNEAGELVVKSFHYIAALAKWWWAGCPFNTLEETAWRYEKCSGEISGEPCDKYGDHACTICGCPVMQEELSIRNKAAMATEKCKHPKGSRWNSLKVLQTDQTI